MRKIEKEMLEAIHAKIDWHKDNTTVVYNWTCDCSIISLHGHEIAEYWHNPCYAWKPLTVNTQTLEQWPTNTTKSRLRALGANVTTHKGITYLNDQAIN